MAGIKAKKVTEVFNGQSDIALFDAPKGGYKDNTSFEDVTASGMSLGQVVEDSTSWEGDDPTIDVIKDEQGDPIVSTVTAGTYAFSCDIADLSAEMVLALMKATKVQGTLSSTSISEVSDVVKFVELPVTTAPIAIFNDEANKWILFPKAKIVGNLTLDSKLWRLHITATAEYIDTDTLGTFMMGKGKPTAETE
ncbi:MAG: hypothetical protein HDR82_09705 [Bacteroides sp.]|nr:hypothetical protein [Bacteroides sp.]